jgi:hypothetical protein
LPTVIGAQFVSMGIPAEMQMRTYHESANKPIYLVWQVLDMRLTVNTDHRRKKSVKPLDLPISQGAPSSRFSASERFLVAMSG